MKFLNVDFLIIWMIVSLLIFLIVIFIFRGGDLFYLYNVYVDVNGDCN